MTDPSPTDLSPAEPIAIHTGRLLLRDFTRTDLGGVAALVGDDEVTQWLSFDSRTSDQAGEMLDGILSRQHAEPRTEYYLAITTSEDPASLAGFVRLGLGGGHHAADLGYALRPAWQGHGYAREAATNLIEYGFTKLGLHRIVANIGPTNQASMNLVEQLGFTYEGTIRDHVHTNGAWRDSRSYSVLAHEWEQATYRTRQCNTP